ncbi:MAG: hypothetical protein IJW17_02150 [Lentisphaeria bacterium]|nr:hypothetical protein [Lentisphaeria bacterium]
MKRTTFFILAAAAMCFAAAGNEVRLINGLGHFRYDDLKFRPTVISTPGWTLGKVHPAKAAAADKGYSGKHLVSLAGKNAGELRWRVSAAGNRLHGSWTFALKSPALRFRYVDMAVPADDAGKLIIVEEGKKRTIAFKANMWQQTKRVTSAELPLLNGDFLKVKISGDVFLTIQDNRKWDKNGGFSVRFVLKNGDTLALDIEKDASQVHAIDISSAANRTFADKVANDKKGGWTDQGPGNDMSVFNASKVKFGKLHFNITDEKKTGKNSVIVVAGTERDMAPAEITLPLPANLNVRGLALLHAAGWVDVNQIGEVIVRYADSGTQTIPINGSRDVGNWWVGGDFSNGKIVWSSRNAIRTVGLYASSFELGGSQPVSLTFRIANPQAIWMIAGVTLTERPVVLPKYVATPVTIKEDENWRPVHYTRYIKPGSPMDFSAFTAEWKPAGKYGYPKVSPEGKLVFSNAPGKRLRINGVNLCETAIYLSKPDAEKLAVYLAAQGINAVRLHHHDNGLVDPASPVSTAINMKRLDRMEYLIAKLKEQGIYISFDVYTSRKLKVGDNLEVFKRFPDYLKGGHTAAKNAFIFCDDAFENWKTFARNWLTHKNPYTGMTLAEDPAVILVNLINEDTIGNGWNHTPGSLSQRFIAEEYRKFLKKNPKNDPTYSTGNPDFVRFIYNQAYKRSKEMMAFLRNELNARFMITSANNGGSMASTWLRDCYDVVDDHIYQDHPMFPQGAWGLPMAFSQSSIISGHGWVPLLVLKGRIYGKPFYITEYDFCAPNVHRSEEGPIMGAYCALNDIDGIFRFNFSSSDWRVTLRGTQMAVFESCQDLVKQISDRIIAALYLRGDVSPAPLKVSHTVPRDIFSKQQDYGYPPLQTSGLLTQIGAVFDDRPVAGVVDHKKITDKTAIEKYKKYQKEKIAESVTGEIRMDTKRKLLEISTPRSAVVTLPEKVQAKSGALKVSRSNMFQTFAAISLDGKTLKKSDSILLLQSTDIAITGLRFADKDLRRQESIGKGKLLMRRGTADIALEVKGKVTVKAVDFQGEILGEIPSQMKGNVVIFKADNFKFAKGIAGYHIIPEKK